MRVIARARRARAACRSTCASSSAIQPAAEGLRDCSGDEHRRRACWRRATSPTARRTTRRWCSCSRSTSRSSSCWQASCASSRRISSRAFAGRILNVHPSLLPKYRGLHTHRRVLEAGETLHGVSVHFVTEELDGGPVIIQAEVPVRPDGHRNDAFSASSAAANTGSIRRPSTGSRAGDCGCRMAARGSTAGHWTRRCGNRRRRRRLACEWEPRPETECERQPPC